MPAYASPSSRPTCLTSSAGGQPRRHAAVTERRRKPAISRLTACVQPGDCSAASSLRYSAKTALVTPADGIDRHAHRGHDELPLRMQSLLSPGDQPRPAARAARPRWRSLSFSRRRLRLAFPTMRTSVNSGLEDPAGVGNLEGGCRMLRRLPAPDCAAPPCRRRPGRRPSPPRRSHGSRGRRRDRHRTSRRRRDRQPRGAL